MSDTKKIKEELTAKRPKETAIPAKDFVSTGFTPLNLACSGRTDGGFAKGRCYLVVGDSDSGKTWLSHTIMAEAAKNPEFDDYRFIRDMPEHGASMDVAGYFGQKLADRLHPVKGTQEEPEYSRDLTEFYENINETLDEGPCIYFLDSMDALETEEDRKEEEKKKTARKTKTKASGSYGTSKPKENSRKLRPLVNKLEETGSILIIVAQTRQNIGFTAKFQPRTRSGGDALKFYSRIEMWLSIKQRITHKKHKNRQLGQITKVRITKNHITGWEGYVLVPFVRGVGVDDIGGCVDFLAEHHWSTKGKEDDKTINAEEFGVEGKREKIVQHIESNNKEKKLRMLVRKIWYQIEEEIKLKRKPRYD
jgi:RecA/RadA recombinase